MALQVGPIAVTRASLLLFDPRNMFSDRLVCEEQFLGVISFGKFFFVWYQVVDTVVTFFADHQAATAHILFAETVDISFLPVNGSGNEMVHRQRLLTTAQF